MSWWAHGTFFICLSDNFDNELEQLLKFNFHDAWTRTCMIDTYIEVWIEIYRQLKIIWFFLNKTWHIYFLQHQTNIGFGIWYLFVYFTSNKKQGFIRVCCQNLQNIQYSTYTILYLYECVHACRGYIDKNSWKVSLTNTISILISFSKALFVYNDWPMNNKCYHS